MANQVAYGFMNLAEIMGRRVTEVGVSVVTDAIEQSVAEHNRQMDAILALFVERTTDFKIRYRTPIPARLQPLTQDGRALPIVTAGNYDVSFPLQMAGIAAGKNYVTGQLMTVAEASELTSALLESDFRWMRDHILAALFTNVSWTHTDPEKGALTIQGLANADAVLYQVRTGADVGGTDNHYLAQANTIGAGADNPFGTIRSELLEHPENGGEVVVFVPTNLKASIVALTTFNSMRDPNITTGANADVLTGNLGVNVPGDIFGYEDAKVWLSEWMSLPDNYMVAVTTQGPRPLKMREYPEASLQGFNKVAARDDHPWYEEQYMRICGFGANNRVGAVVQRIGNASYAIPTNYTSPMP